MDSLLQQRLDKLLTAYSRHYDIQRDVQVEGGYFPATAEFYLRDENRLLTKEHIYSALEQHEYVYFYVAEHLDAATLRQQIALSQQVGLARVHPHKEHMCSYVTLVVLANRMDPDAAVLVRKTRLHKNYRWTLHGWMDYRVAAMETATGQFFSNPAGREARKTLENNFGSRSQYGKGESIHEWIGSFTH